MSDYQYQVSLRLQHPSWEPEAATSALGLTPTRSWRAGEPRASPNGAPPNGVHKESYWTAKVAEGRSQQISLGTAISDVIESLSPNRQFLIDFVASGGSAELFIGWFFDGRNSGDVLDWRLLDRLSQMRISLSFDVYGG